MARVIVFSIDIKIHSKVGFVEIMGKHVSTRFEINTNLISMDWTPFEATDC